MMLAPTAADELLHAAEALQQAEACSTVRSRTRHLEQVTVNLPPQITL